MDLSALCHYFLSLLFIPQKNALRKRWILASIQVAVYPLKKGQLCWREQNCFSPAQMSQTTGVNELLLNIFRLLLKAHLTQITKKNTFSQLPSAEPCRSFQVHMPKFGQVRLWNICRHANTALYGIPQALLKMYSVICKSVLWQKQCRRNSGYPTSKSRDRTLLSLSVWLTGIFFGTTLEWKPWFSNDCEISQKQLILSHHLMQFLLLSHRIQKH